MDSTELLENLRSCGLHLATEQAGPNDLAKGIGLALLALGELLKGTSIGDNPEVQAPELAFKAKASRW